MLLEFYSEEILCNSRKYLNTKRLFYKVKNHKPSMSSDKKHVIGHLIKINSYDLITMVRNKKMCCSTT